MKAYTTAAANEARRASVDHKLQRLRKILKDSQRQRLSINVATVARLASVSRTFLYENDDARTLIQDARANECAAPEQVRLSPPSHAGDAMWRERALNAEAGIKEAHREISQQRGVMADLMGRIREIDDADHPAEVTQRIQAENTTLKQRVLQLEADNRALAQKLAAARENARFLDRRLADLEVQHVDQTLCDPAEAP